MSSRTTALTWDLGRTLPMPVLRVAGPILAAASFAVAPWPWAVVVVGLALLGALLPGTLANWGAIIVLGLVQLAHPLALDGRASLVLLVAHLLHVQGGLALALPFRGRLQWRALAPVGRRALLVQAGGQGVLWLGMAASALPLAGMLPAGSVAVSVAVAIALLVLLAHLRSRR